MAFTELVGAAAFVQEAFRNRERLFTEHAPSGRFGAVLDAFRERLFEGQRVYLLFCDKSSIFVHGTRAKRAIWAVFDVFRERQHPAPAKPSRQRLT